MKQILLNITRAVLPALFILSCSNARVAADPPKEDKPRATEKQSTDTAAVREAVESIAKSADGTVGIYALHLESGRTFDFNADQRFAMMSVVKLPLAVAVLKKVDEGKLSLDQQLKLEPTDFSPGYSPLAKRARWQGVSVSVRQLVELMVIDSDNTACDFAMRALGGPGEVDAAMRKLGIDGINVSRTEAELALAMNGLPYSPMPQLRSEKEWDRLFAAASDKQRAEGVKTFLADTRDTATPKAVADLFVKVFEGKALSASLTTEIMRILGAVKTGPNRIKGLLPANTPVAHKTGTADRVGATNDAGIITLPGNAGHLVIAVMFKGGTGPVAARERTIAEISRTLYNHFSTA